MSVFKTTFSRALRVAIGYDIPFPNVIVFGASGTPQVDKLVDTTKDFKKLNVAPGDIVYDIDNYQGAVVLEVNVDNLVLNADIFSSSGMNYNVYQASSQTGLGNQGCFLYIGEDGNYTVITIGGDEVEFKAAKAGTILPVQVIKVKNGANCVALW